ncbi:MAG: DUF4416 family protein [Spirochaetales bacterium]|nr:DUF4416 family protein [Spirochaetales bacterium]
MGHIKPYTPVKLVTGILTSAPAAEPALLRELTARFGTIDYRSPSLPFGYTGYYDGEMGTPITRFFFSFSDLILPDRLSGIKRATNLIETSFMIDGNRKVNIDPGILSLSNFILATTKISSHRIPLTDGMYGEITLLFQKGSFRPLEWTYPDYRDGKYIGILNTVRELYKKQLESNK